MSLTLRFSAHKLLYPGGGSICCCCFRRGTDDWFRAKSTRTSGVKVVRTYSKWWDFPYCGECADWRRALQRAEAAESAYTTRLVTTWLAGVFAAICLAG